MKVLVINCGSSSLKYQVLDMTNEELICKGLVERIGMEGSVISHTKTGMDKFILEAPMKDHKDAIGHVIDALKDADHGVVKDMSEIGAVGHRVVHAGEKFAHSVLITDEVIKALEECVELAPLHNPPNLLGIAACQELMPGTPMVIRQCRLSHTFMLYLMNTTKNTVSEDTASTVQATSMYQKEQQKCSMSI